MDRLEAECARLQKRIDQAYLDKLDGVIDTAFFERKSGEWRAEQRELRRQIVKHEQANQAYLEEGLMLMDLGREAADLFAEQDPDGRRKLLNFMVSNSSWAAGELKVEWRIPFDLLEELATASSDGTPLDEPSSGGPSRMVTLTRRFSNWVVEAGSEVKRLSEAAGAGFSAGRHRTEQVESATRGEDRTASQ